MAGEQSAYTATGNPILITDTYMSDIADAIRTKTGSVDTYTPAQMASAISAIETGGGSSSDAFITAMETNKGLSYPGRYQFSRIDYSPSTTNYLLGIFKEYEGFTACRDGLISYPFAIVAKRGNYYTIFIFTPTGWAYTLAKNYNYWAPTYTYGYGTSLSTPINIWIASGSSSQLYREMKRPLLYPTTPVLCFATEEVLGSAAVPASAKSNTTPTIYGNRTPHLWLYNKAPQDEYTTTTEPNKRWLYSTEYIYFIGWASGSV